MAQPPADFNPNVTLSAPPPEYVTTLSPFPPNSFPPPLFFQAPASPPRPPPDDGPQFYIGPLVFPVRSVAYILTVAVIIFLIIALLAACRRARARRQRLQATVTTTSPQAPLYPQSFYIATPTTGSVPGLVGAHGFLTTMPTDGFVYIYPTTAQASVPPLTTESLTAGATSSSGGVRGPPGVPEHLIGSLGRAFEYDAEKVGEKECTVCLGEYKEGDVLRQLRACGHTFHEVRRRRVKLRVYGECGESQEAWFYRLRAENLDTFTSQASGMRVLVCFQQLQLLWHACSCCGTPLVAGGRNRGRKHIHNCEHAQVATQGSLWKRWAPVLMKSCQWSMRY